MWDVKAIARDFVLDHRRLLHCLQGVQINPEFIPREYDTEEEFRIPGDLSWGQTEAEDQRTKSCW